MQQAIYDVMASTEDGGGNSSSSQSYLLIGGTAIVIVSILGIQSIVSVFVEHKHFHLLSEAAVSILLGLIVGLIVFLAVDTHTFAVDQSFFFFGLLPIIIFKEGYGLNKQHFFKNFFYVCLYGIAGTIFNFILICAMTYGMVQLKWYQIEDDTQSLGAILIYSACITSKDSAVSLQVLNFDLTPKLHSIIFGEQILNDVVVFSLQKTSLLLEKSLNKGETPQWYYVFIFIGLIILQILVSLIVGLILGTLATWITKKCRFFIHHSSIITAFTIYFGYLAFALCEAFEFCGVISVLVCGIMLSHYQTYNLPKISSQSSKITVKALSYVSETVIYIYIGFYALVRPTKNNTNSTGTIAEDIPFSYKFFFVQLLIVIPFSRFFSLLLSHGFALLFRLKTKGKWRINRYEFFIIFYCGLIRGVVAFALVSEEKPPNDSQQLDTQIKIAQELTLYIVLFTTLIIGGSLKYVCEFVYKIMDDNNILRSSSLALPNNHNRKTFILEEKDSYKLFHPKSEKLFKRLDEQYIKPFLIYNYVERKDDIRQAKKEERKKLEYEQEAEEKLYDDSVRHRRLEKQQQQQQQQQQQSERHSENPSERSKSNTDQPQQMELSVPIQKNIIQQSPEQFQKDLHITESRIIADQSNDQIVNQSKQ